MPIITAKCNHSKTPFYCTKKTLKSKKINNDFLRVSIAVCLCPVYKNQKINRNSAIPFYDEYIR